jgi:hypothetical protein
LPISGVRGCANRDAGVSFSGIIKKKLRGRSVTVWVDRDRAFLARRYDRLASLITFFEWLLFVPGRFREKAVATLELRPGDRDRVRHRPQCALLASRGG